MHLQSSRLSSGATAPKQLHRDVPSPGRPVKTRMRCRFAVLKYFLLRVDVSVSIVYLLILLCVAVPIVVVSQVYLTRMLVASWRTVHNTRVYYITERISISTISVRDIANGFMALNIPGGGSYGDHDLMENLCSSLDNYDKLTRFRALSLVSLETESAISCIHGIPTMDSMRTLTGYFSHDNIINGTYLIDSETYDFVQPPQMVTEWPESARDISAAKTTTYSGVPILELLPAYLDGSVDSVDSRHHWILPTIMPHIICYILPVGYLARGRTDISSVRYTDFTQVLLDGSRMLLDYDFVEAPGLAMAAFINQSLADDDPLVLSNSWGQPSVSNDSIYSIFTTVPVTYLKASNISDPLMRAALQHVDLAALQHEGYRRSVDFEYAGAAAVVTAYAYTTAQGLVVPLVVASSHAAITTPYLFLMRIFDGILVAVILLLTGASFNSARCLISQPLRRITALMLASMSAGRRALFYTTTSNTLLQLTEVHALIKAHNAAMQQLREIDAFVPDELRAEGRAQRAYSSVSNIASSMGISNGRKVTKFGSRCLDTHLSTAVFVTIRAPAALSSSSAVLPRTPSPPPILAEQGEQKPLRGQRLVSVVKHAAQAANTANSGPFPTPAALTAFITAVHELCHTHHGTLHRLCPDACVLHFNSAVRAHLPRGPGDASAAAAPAAAPPAPAARHGVPAAQSAPQPRPPRATRQEEMRLRAAQDARNAAAFALDLVNWTAAQSGSGENAQRDGTAAMPDVRALLDTSMFTCGQYRPAGSEQTLQVALGRDVQRDLGRVPQRIGVRVAMTEETATLLRAEDDSGSRGRGNMDAGVRQIPVDVLRTGRAGLDGDVVVLYEALPGRVAGDAAWQLYARCCCGGFEHMLRGDYAGALAAYRGVAEIADLEPGLLPAAMRREAAASAVTGGAVSVQVARLMRECERRVRLRITEPLCTAISSLLGVDQVLSKWALEDVPEGSHPDCAQEALVEAEKSIADGRLRRSSRRSAQSFGELAKYPEVRHRCVVHFQERQVTLRCVLPSAPRWIRDHIGLCWHLSRSHGTDEATPVWSGMQMALGSAGFIASVSFSTFRDLHPVVAKAIRDAPPGPMSDALRSATPVCGPSPEQEAFMKATLLKHQHLRHPNIVSLIGYSHSLEGGVVLIWEFSPGGTLRELLNRYGRLPAITTIRFGLHALSALSFLHENNIAHGNLNLDTVMVDSDGSCRLVGLYTHERLPFALPQTHYISPLMATGALPTPACDVFCYGLGALEGLTLQPCWRWATKEDGEPYGAASELLDLMKNGGHAFCDAVVQGRVVANAEAFDTPLFAEKYSELARSTLRSCVSHTPSDRPTAVEVRNIVKILLSEGGLACEEDEV
ncbi:protein kinase [Leishmania donovani]|uniref:Protein_kinase_putative/GeneDB:LmjF.08.0660 n=1 Tax=Leishmania donovani TaxID=5661 RepID=A0A6J8FHN3_LEIDO|nr:protein kinase [Leishmania donovani]VDZ47225.1 protein_kinase_putative/GeneDB:LmjF.08.0660 [Leishmania donovani]